MSIYLRHLRAIACTQCFKEANPLCSTQGLQKLTPELNTNGYKPIKLLLTPGQQ